MKSIVLFLATFVVGAALALGARTVMHKPHEASASAAIVTPATLANPHAGHTAQPAAPAETKTVNSICPICGMDVDPSIKTATYQGKTVGFGCGACPAKFAKDPERYGPAALRNEVAPR